jgi:ATP-dependent DNA ligase
MYAKPVKNLPEGPDWLYEIKLDGYRSIAARDSTGVTLWSRRANSFTDQFPHIAQACEKLPLDTVVDGEIVALDQTRRTSFNLLQHHRSGAAAIKFYIFDLLAVQGKDLQKVQLMQRREALQKLMKPFAGKDSRIAISEIMHTAPQELIRVVKEFGLEGIVAKHKDSLYESGKRTGAWVKYRINKGQEFVIGGYTQGNPFDAVIVGYYEGGKLIYAAKVRNAFCAIPSPGANVAHETAFDGDVPICKLTREKKNAMGTYERRNEKMRLAAARACSADRLYRMDA